MKPEQSLTYLFSHATISLHLRVTKCSVVEEKIRLDLRCSSNFETNASKFRENIEYMFSYN